MAERCKICDTRRPRRHCPGVEGDICSVCCGVEREVTVSCPLECGYLLEARKHEKAAEAPLLYPEVKVTDNFMARNEILLLLATQLWWRAASEREGVVDSDLREAMASVVQTMQTAQAGGLIYTGKPENAVAAALQESFLQKFAEWRAEVEQRAAAEGLSGMVRDGDVLKMMIFLARLADSTNNGRPRCRAFYDVLRGWNERVTRPEVAASNPA